MKKLLLTLSLVLGFITLAKATDVTMPESGKKWTDYGEKSPITVQGYSFAYTNGKMYDSDFRLYSGATLTITAPEGKSFTKVVVKAASGNEAAKATLAGSNANAWKVSTSGSGQNLVVTFEATSPQTSLAFKGATSKGDNKQFKIGTFTITEEGGEDVPNVVKEPTFSVASGEVKAGTEVRISCATDDATVYYTTDNSTPSASNGTEYSAPIVVNEAMTIKAIAVKDGMTPSSVATASYTIKQIVPITGNTATFNFSEPATLTPGYSADANHDVDGVEFSNNKVTIVNNKNDSGNTAKLWSNGHTYRIYSGSLLTIAVPKGYKFTSVQFDCSEGLAGLNAFTPGSYNSTTGVLTFDDVVANKVTCVLSAKVFIKSITVNFAKIEVAAPVVKLPEDYGTASDSPVNLTNYTSGATNKYFDVTVTWDEGLTLVYSTTSRRTQLNDVELKYPEQPSKPAAVRAAAESEAPSPLENPITGEISEGPSAKFSFASLGEFKCYTKDAAGNVSDPIIMTFEGVASGVEDIAADAEVGEAQFFNMQGVRVANPAAGNLYIKVQGDKATKVLVK